MFENRRLPICFKEGFIPFPVTVGSTKSEQTCFFIRSNTINSIKNKWGMSSAKPNGLGIRLPEFEKFLIIQFQNKYNGIS